MMSNVVSLRSATAALETLTDEERAALRASRFHSEPAPAPLPSTGRSRLAHPGGALATNKMVALEKFLKKKLSEGSLSLDPDLVRNAVDNAKASSRSGLSVASESVRHVHSFSGSDEEQSDDVDSESEKKTEKRKRAHKLVKGGPGESSTSDKKIKKSKKKMDGKIRKQKRGEASGRKTRKDDKLKISPTKKRHKHISKKK